MRPEDPAYTDPRYAEVETQIPHRRLEAWKWTDVRKALGAKPEGLSAELTPEFRDDHDVSIAKLDVRDGHPLSVLFERFGRDAYVVEIPAGEDAGTLEIASLERGNGAVRIVMGEGSTLSLVEHHAGEADTFINCDFDIQLGAGATLSRVVLQDDKASTVRIATTRIRMEAEAKLRQHVLATGAALSRFETRVEVAGENVEIEANGAYLLRGERHADFTTLIELEAPGAHVRQAVKGIVTDRARGVFQGKFAVARAAQKTDAEMRHDALMLSDRSQVRAKPELEIYADDVACAHGNTLGQLDESALFYMRQRGIPETRARAMLVEAFVADVFDGVDNADVVMARLSAAMDGLFNA